MKKMSVLGKFQINGYEDRIKIISVFADNGYPVVVEKKKGKINYLDTKYFITVYENQNKKE